MPQPTQAQVPPLTLALPSPSLFRHAQIHVPAMPSSVRPPNDNPLGCHPPALPDGTAPPPKPDSSRKLAPPPEPLPAAQSLSPLGYTYAWFHTEFGEAPPTPAAETQSLAHRSANRDLADGRANAPESCSPTRQDHCGRAEFPRADIL